MARCWPSVSDLTFEVVGARAEPHAVVPTLVLRLRIRDATEADIQAVTLRVQLQIEPRRRHYASVEEGRLQDLFGEPERWGDTLKTLLWTHASLTVTAFRGTTEVDIPIPCTYDFEVASAKYFHGLEDGDVPILLLFSGTVFARNGQGGMAIDQVPWHAEAPFRLPVRVWRDVMDLYFPGTAWIRLRRDTFDALHRYRGQQAMTSWEDAIEGLLEHAGQSELEHAGQSEPV